MEFFWKKKTIISFILALMVIFIHSTALDHYLYLYPDDSQLNIAVDGLNKFLHGGINAVAVPLFYIISGATFFRDYDKSKYLGKIRSRFKSLVLPYLIWNSLAMCFDIICSYTPLSQFFSGRDLFELSVPNVLEGIFLYSRNCAFWFLFAVIVFVILTPVFDIATCKPWIGWIFVAFTLTLPLYALDIFYAVRMEADSVVFYALGVMIGKYYFKFFSEESGISKILVSAAAFVLSLALKLLMVYEVLPDIKMVSQMTLIIMSLSFWFMLDGFIRKVKMRAIFTFSFFIYALHQNVVSSFIKLLQMALPKNLNMAIPNMMISYVITVAAILCAAWLIKKYLPKVYNVLSGSR